MQRLVLYFALIMNLTFWLNTAPIGLLVDTYDIQNSHRLTTDQKLFIIHYLVPAVAAYLQSGIQAHGGWYSWHSNHCTSMRRGYSAQVTTLKFHGKWADPTFWMISICPAFITEFLKFPLVGNKRILYHKAFMTLIHEIFHTIGFHQRSLCEYPRKCEAKLRRGDRIVTLYNYTRNLEGLSAARKHFGCSSLVDLELNKLIDADGRDVPDADHLNTRTYMGEIMTLTPGLADESISGITIGLLRDLGWKIASNTLTTGYAWGKGIGCDYSYSPCIQNSTAINSDYFCVQNSKGCSQNGLRLSSCQLRPYTRPLLPQYRYFSDVNQGGAYSDTAFCPVYIDQIVSCQPGAPKGDETLRCIRIPPDSPGQPVRTECLDTFCRFQRCRVAIGPISVDCTVDDIGKIKRVGTREIICPNVTTYSSAGSFCSGVGDFMEDELLSCRCIPGYTNGPLRNCEVPMCLEIYNANPENDGCYGGEKCVHDANGNPKCDVVGK
jgi:hypothetical protein